MVVFRKNVETMKRGAICVMVPALARGQGAQQLNGTKRGIESLSQPLRYIASAPFVLFPQGRTCPFLSRARCRLPKFWFVSRGVSLLVALFVGLAASPARLVTKGNINS